MSDRLHELAETCALIRDSVTLALDDYDSSPEGLSDAYLILIEDTDKLIERIIENIVKGSQP